MELGKCLLNWIERKVPKNNRYVELVVTGLEGCAGWEVNVKNLKTNRKTEGRCIQLTSCPHHSSPISPATPFLNPSLCPPSFQPLLAASPRPPLQVLPSPLAPEQSRSEGILFVRQVSRMKTVFWQRGGVKSFLTRHLCVWLALRGKRITSQ